MRHVDDGTIHAWLDGQITDPARAAAIEEHVQGCAECTARLADERTTFDSAQALLAASAPSAGEGPSFDELVAKAGHAGLDRATSSAWPLAHPRRNRRVLQAGWAASIMLAVGLGWTARQLTEPERPRSDASPAIREQAANRTIEPTDAAAGRESAPDRLTSREPSNVGSAGPRARQGEEAGPRPTNTATPAPPQASMQTADAARLAKPEAQAEAAAPAPEAGDVPAVAAPPPAAAPSVAVSAPIPQPRLEALTVSAETVARTLVPESTGWRPLPRTEAAARSGMPLYGIEGFEPVLTALSADGTLVRTMYRLASGDIVELVQQRALPGVAGVAPVENTRRAFTQARRGAVVDQTAPERTWSSVRGDVRVTLRTGSGELDLNALGEKLRVD